MSLPRGYWGPALTRPILDKVLTVRYEVDLTDLSAGERSAVDELVAACGELQPLAEGMLHHQALSARSRLVALHERLGRPAETADLLELYDVFQGPIATTLENELRPFLPVDPWAAGRNLYPWAISADELETFLAARPERRREILDLHTVVRRTEPRAVRRDLGTLRRYPVLDGLHPGLRDHLERLATGSAPEPFYAVPYSVAWPERLLAISGHLWRAASAVVEDDPDFAAFLRQRARDLLTDDNEPGDAAWVRGTFRRLDVVVGSYGTYDDQLFGAKGWIGLAILVQEPSGTAELHALLPHLQAIEDELPIDRHRTVPAHVPVGSYDVVGAVGEAVGTVAEILPDDPDLIRKYGRKIILRRNYSLAEGPFERIHARWRATMAPAHHGELTALGTFRQTTWHEVGHYLGPDTDHMGRSFIEAMGDDSSMFEELKAELASAFAASRLERAGAFTRQQAIEVLAAVILGGLRPVRPRRTEHYSLLGLLEFNYFMHAGLLRSEPDGLHIDHDRATEVIESMLRDVLALQDHGTRVEANDYIERWSTWDDRNERVASQLRETERARTVFARFAVFDGATPRA